MWSTFLDNFCQEATSPPLLDVEYISCYLGCQPLRDLTPYCGIRAVLPAHYVAIADHTVANRPHWNWFVKDQIIHNSDAEYEEHFLELFKQSVARRTSPGGTLLAQLSGGMDSSAIVCMSDHLRIMQGASNADLVDTISFYDDTEHNWNEKPYFMAVESKRGKQGIHIDSSAFRRTYEPPEARYLLPSADKTTLLRESFFRDAIGGKGYRVIISGVGGDEMLGGVPSPIPEMSDFMRRDQRYGRLKEVIDDFSTQLLALKIGIN